MPTPYQAGRYYEYQCAKQLRAAGYEAVRTAGSHGPFDVIAWNNDELKLVQVKKASGPRAVTRALAASKFEWTHSQQPPECCVTLETWIYSYGTVDKFTH